MGDQSGRLEAYRQAAEDYPLTALAQSPLEAAGLKQKPFDWSAGHPAFFELMYLMLNGVQALSLPANARVVEVGSGAGWATCFLMGLGYKVTCVEPSAAMIAAARENLVQFAARHAFEILVPNVRFECATLEECEIADGWADGVLFFESLHHLADERRAADQTYRILRPGGRLAIVGEFNWKPGDEQQSAILTGEMDRFGTLESPFTHLYLEQVLREAGFVDITRHHGVNGFIPVEREQASVREVSTFSAANQNNYTARRP
jgi:SAM-dependent methyltransferase